MGRHRLWALTLTLAVATGSAVAPPSTAGTAPLRDRRLASVRSFALAIGSGSLRGDLTRRYRGYDLVVLDGSEATGGQVAALRAHGRLVLGYLDVGTIERARPWSHAAPAYRLGLWADWGEYYADVSRPALRRLMADQVAPTILAKGFDGLFLDNVDMVAGHPSQGVGMRLLVGAIAARVHAAGGLLFSQNGGDSIAPLLGYLDGWNREDPTSTYDFARRAYRRQSRPERRRAHGALARMARAGLLVTTTDYTRRGDAAGAEASRRMACGAGAVPFVSDMGLTRVAQPPARC